MQFNTICKFGLSLGYQYTHKNFSSKRSSIPPWHDKDDFDVYDFIGFNSHFESRSQCLPANEKASIEVPFGQRSLKRHEVDSFETLQAFVQAVVSAHLPSVENTLLVRFAIASHEGRRLFNWVQSQIPDFQDGLILRNMYFEARESNPWDSVFDPGRTKFLVRIR